MSDIIQEGRADAVDLLMRYGKHAERHERVLPEALIIVRLTRLLLPLLDIAEAAGRAEALLPENAECGGPEQNRDVHERVAALRAAITRLQDSP